ncbi:hypothetical protein CERSUDRAFT_96331 [Gelatoporia subvermispora B]|uniref:Uncharacterized protein n=1 Tax=Ceriporiopsis subvermispora (strain B) TaxID=914234 RepID=M2QVI0_CERS8|nr:hypothetical protein CERSUDRAFT_96331 [Gelatoporia subvermispora B]
MSPKSPSPSPPLAHIEQSVIGEGTKIANNYSECCTILDKALADNIAQGHAKEQFDTLWKDPGFTDRLFLTYGATGEPQDKALAHVWLVNLLKDQMVKLDCTTTAVWMNDLARRLPMLRSVAKTCTINEWPTHARRILQGAPYSFNDANIVALWHMCKDTR